MELIALFLIFFFQSGSPDISASILVLTGARTMEELDETELERYSSLAEHPLDINACTRSRLLSSGLFSQYQVASFLEWRSRSGDILSYSELALVDGFNEEYAEALRPFTVLRSKDPPGHRRKLHVSQSATARTSVKLTDGSTVAAYGLKYQAEFGERAELSYSNRTTYSATSPGWGSGSAAWYGNRFLGKAVLGAFNARFGQGLVCWSGFSMSGFSSAQAFSRNASGLSPSSSYTPSYTGLACDVNWMGFTASAAYSFGQGMPVANVSWIGKKITAGVTATSEAASADFRLGLPGLSLFSEIACSYIGAPAALAGAIWVPSYGSKVAFLTRWYSGDYSVSSSGAARSGTKTSDETGAAVAAAFGPLDFTFDWAMHPNAGTEQFKGICVLSHAFPAGPLTITPSLRINSRYKSYLPGTEGKDLLSWRNDLRTELTLAYGNWQLKGRWNGVWCRDFAWIWFAELQRSGPLGHGTLLFNTRFSLFKADSWDDRIYAYERDVPGYFTVPACYGRGWSLYGLLGWKLPKWRRKVGHSLYFRASVQSYPWNLEPKEGKTELRLQYSISM